MYGLKGIEEDMYFSNLGLVGLGLVNGVAFDQKQEHRHRAIKAALGKFWTPES